MKILSWEGIRVVLQEQDKLKQRDNMFRLEAIAKAQHKDTLRQVIELLEGWRRNGTHLISDEAIQTIRALLEE